MRQNQNQKILRMVEMAMLVALVVVLQLFGGAIKIGPFSLTLVLIPVVVGSIILGPWHGAILGAIFGLVVTIQCATGVDAGGFVLWGINPFFTALICLVKGSVAGMMPGLLYRLIGGSDPNPGRARSIFASMIASVSAPILNTGLFLLGLSTMFNDTLVAWAGGTNVGVYIITGLVGFNFLIEFAINLIVSPGISTVVKVVTRKKA